MILLQERTTSWDIPSLLPFAPRGLVALILLGLVAGWLARKLARGRRGFGCIGDILLGLIGSVAGGWIFTKLGIVHENRAVVLVAIGHLFFGGKNG